MRAIFGAVDLVEGFGGGEEGSWGVKGEGGIARLEERKGVDVTVRVERISLEISRSRSFLLLGSFQSSVVERCYYETKACFVLPFGKDRTVCKCNEC